MNREKVLLVIIEYKQRKKGVWPFDEVLEEMEELVKACGGEVIDHMVCREDKPSAKCLIGEGKVAEIAEILTMKKVDTVIFSHDLKGSQQRNIEKVISCKTIDRTQLILDIFARHATTREGKTQVELAQLEYLLPRLVGKGIELSRLGGGIGTLGPGETKLEIDRRRISQRVTRLKKDLAEIAASRHLKRKKRIDKNVPAVSLVGYTNAGKSTLLNVLADAGQITKNGLFTTLESLSRQIILPNNQRVVLSDTVGFMQELPHHLIESFKATLEEVREADILIHVLDISNPNFKHLHDAVFVVLKQLDIGDKPVLTVLNKIDQFEDPGLLEALKNDYEHAVCISAKNGDNVDELLVIIENMLSHFIKEINVDVPINRMDLVNLAHKEGEVYSVKYYEDKVNIRAVVPAYLAGRFYLGNKPKEELEDWE